MSQGKKTIWKFRIDGEEPIEMPVGAEILTLQMQFGIPHFWALVDPSAPREVRQFRIFGTGCEIPADAGTYRGTFPLKGGSLVAHVFEPQS